jgi:hypothetical protein
VWVLAYLNHGGVDCPVCMCVPILSWVIHVFFVIIIHVVFRLFYVFIEIDKTHDKIHSQDHPPNNDDRPVESSRPTTWQHRLDNPWYKCH